MRTFRKVLDPHSVCSPGRKVFTEEELKRLPQPLVDALNQVRQANGMAPIKLPAGCRQSKNRTNSRRLTNNKKSG